jgi:hypothetical protein
VTRGAGPHVGTSLTGRRPPWAVFTSRNDPWPTAATAELLAVRAEGREEGIEEERAAMILRILEWRAIPVPDAVRERVTGCTDLNQLEVWAKRAVHATTAEELFVDDSA